MTDPGTPHTETENCEPLRIDFDKFAEAVFTGKRAKVEREGDRRLLTVEHAIGHLREETGLDDRQIAKVLFTTGAVLADMLRASQKWNAVGCANWLALCGEQLWRESAPPQASAEPETELDSRYWAVWTRDGRIRAVEEFAEPRTRDQVRAKLAAESDAPLGELEPVIKSRAEELRDLIQRVRR